VHVFVTLDIAELTTHLKMVVVNFNYHVNEINKYGGASNKRITNKMVRNDTITNLSGKPALSGSPMTW